ncbi:tyrosine-protein phosphatase non-receptor type 11-like [Nomascus leucogenys]|uniref:tyrosine-protein phosphatase non-receptor type 11-like n=1 Tax=Nomascus leucogenys TaxID=61853 RepID=UPI00122D8454|nr:tyrosine-protein phosphatase non-receptor type 11-like [Nomascus leucogenys]
MVHQENTRVIVTTTREMERGRVAGAGCRGAAGKADAKRFPQNKCFQDWPELPGSQEFGRVHVRILGEGQAQGCCVPELQVWRPGQEEPQCPVQHFQYFGLPDHGVRADPAGALGFRDEVNRAHGGALQVQRGGAAPAVQAQRIGRTGTIIVIDILVYVISRQGEPLLSGSPHPALL